MLESPEPIHILNVRVDPLTVEQLHQRIVSYIKNDEHALVLNVNIHALNLACDQEWMRDLLNRSHIVFCDGAGVMLGARLLGYRIPERITYADWMWQLAALAEAHGYALFFLGGQPGVADRAADKLTARYPALKIAGTHHGYFDKAADSPENRAVVQQINAAGTQILVTGFGMPVQERWLDENWSHIKANVALTGGAVFDYVSGKQRRAPAWMTNNGLEWLGRMYFEPRRLWRRYAIGIPVFLGRVMRQRLAR